MTDSTPGRSRGKSARPKKPRPDFPLGIHRGTGYWCKKVRGKVHYFGKVADDLQGTAALGEWERVKNDLLAGRTPRTTGDGLTVADLVNRFLTFKRSLVKSNELQQRTWDEYHKVCGTVVQQFGKTRLVSDLASDDFEGLRATFAGTAGPVRLTQPARIMNKSCHGWRMKLIVGPVVKWKTFTLLPKTPTVKSRIGRKADFSHITN